jgi:hypothetical protein
VLCYTLTEVYKKSLVNLVTLDVISCNFDVSKCLPDYGKGEVGGTWECGAGRNVG